MNRIVKLTPVLALMALSACQTLQGAGRDMQAAGQAVARESAEVQASM